MESANHKYTFLLQERYFFTFMKKGLLILSHIIFSLFLLPAQSPVGTWVTIDDKRNVDIAHVKVFMEDGKLYGKVIKLLPEAQNRVCKGCSGAEKDRPIEGMTLIHDVKPNGEKYWSNGKFFDPNSGRNFDCTMWLDSEDILKVRVSLGISILGRTQTWSRLKE